MKVMLNKMAVRAEIKKMALREKLAENAGSWFTENFAAIAIVVVLGLLIVTAMAAIIGKDATSGVMKQINDKISSIFNWTSGT